MVVQFQNLAVFFCSLYQCLVVHFVSSVIRVADDIDTWIFHGVQIPGSLPAVFPHKVSIHNSCHGVRELHLSSPSERNIPYYSKLRDLLSLVKGIEVFEPRRVVECCGFGGMFAIEEPEVSTCMGQDKVKDHMSTGAEYITGADSSCLMHMEGVIKREKLPIKTIHIVQILASGL